MRRAFLPAVLVLALAPSSVHAQKIKEFKFDVTSLGGQRLTEQTFANNVLIVDLWGTWCPPCRQMVPILEGMYRKYKQHGFEIVGFCFERGDGDASKAVRKFASEQGISYSLAIGTPAIQQQVPKLEGYPTLLFFKKGENGIEFDHRESGLDSDLGRVKKKLESWIRVAVGLDEQPEPVAEDKPAEEPKPADEGDEEEKPKGPEPLPKGVIFKPGDGDTGFEFDVQDVAGAPIKFAELRGKPVLLAMTSSWDQEAAGTAKLLNKVHSARGESVHVIAASLELKKDRAEVLAAIKAFSAKNEVKYRVFPAGLSFQKKIHLFHGMPLFLVFDKDGTLVLRESGSSYEKIEEALNAKLDELGK